MVVSKVADMVEVECEGLLMGWTVGVWLGWWFPQRSDILETSSYRTELWNIALNTQS